MICGVNTFKVTESELREILKKLPGFECSFSSEKQMFTQDYALKVHITSDTFGFSHDMYIVPVRSREFFLRAFASQLQTFLEAESIHKIHFEPAFEAIEDLIWRGNETPFLPEHYYA